MKKLEKRDRKSGNAAATSYDVAELAGVAQSTVSRCFKPGASVTPETRARILKIADELGYRPNAIARGLITRRSNLVAVIITNLTNLHYPDVLVQLTERFAEQGIRVLLFALARESDVDEILDQVWSYRVDGAVVAARLSTQQIGEFRRRRIPLVLYNRMDETMQCDSVCCDSIAGERQLVQGLVAAGHRHFGIIAGARDAYVGEERVRAAREHLRVAGFDDVPIVQGALTYDGGASGLRRLWTQTGRKLDAVICVNDTLAFGALDTARKRIGLAVPEQLSVVGFNGVEPARWDSYNLTTISQPVSRMTEVVVSILMARIEDPEHLPEARIFPGTLVLGESARFVQEDQAVPPRTRVRAQAR